MACNCGCGSNFGFRSNFGFTRNTSRRGCTCLANDVRDLIEDLEDAFEDLEDAGCIRSTTSTGSSRSGCSCNRSCGCN